MIGRFDVSRTGLPAPKKCKDGAVDFLRKSILDTTNRPPTIAQMVCVTSRVTKASPSPLQLVEATRVGTV
jgi:hypothetical protein